MQAQAEQPPFAWQPLTPRGISAFAYASWGRLVGVQLIFALLAAGAVLWVLHTAWFPTIVQSILRLPDRGEIRSGRLNWAADSPQRLAEGRFLSLAVDLKHEGQVRSPAHVQVEFGLSDWKAYSLFGFRQYAYPKGVIVAFNRRELDPWWGAWSPVILAVV